jgi:hypothetical protein
MNLPSIISSSFLDIIRCRSPEPHDSRFAPVKRNQGQNDVLFGR